MFGSTRFGAEASYDKEALRIDLTVFIWVIIRVLINGNKNIK